MQLVVNFILIFVLFSQKVNNQDSLLIHYDIINEAFTKGPRPYKRYPLYSTVEPDTVFLWLKNLDPDLAHFARGITEEELQEMLRQFDWSMLNTSISGLKWDKNKLHWIFKIRKSRKKGIISSRPIVSNNYALIYFKTPYESYTEGITIVKKIDGVWVDYAEIFVSSRSVHHN